MPRPRARARRLIGAASAGVVVSGLLVNVYLAVVARALPPAGYAAFGSFWAIALVLGFGAFLPLEQELARGLSRSADPRSLLRSAVPAAGVLAVLAVLVLLAATPVVLPALGDDAAAYAALAALCVVSAGQFLLRGVLIGTDRLVRHGAVMVLDGLLRLAAATVLLAVGGVAATVFCWALVAAIALSHLPLLPGALRRAVSAPTAAHEGTPVRRRDTTVAVMPLLLGSICAQLLLNGLPVLVVAVSSSAEDGAAGVYLAAFTLAKAPLSMVVPLQSAVVPTLSRLLATGRRREVLVLLAKGAVGLGALAAAAVPAALWLGPPVVALVLGDDYAANGLDLAVIVVGVLAHIGLVVVTQVHVARGWHGTVAATWLSGLTAAAATFLAVGPPVLAGELAFLVGSVVGAVVSGLILVRRRRGAGIDAGG